MSDAVANVVDPNAGALALPNLAALQQASEYAEAPAGIYGTFGRFHPRLQLFTSNSDPVKRGIIPVATYGIIKGTGDPIVLGKQVLVIPLAWRAKAMFVKSDPPLAFHKPGSKEFQDIKRKADADSNSGNMYGPEFLLHIEEHGYVTFFMGSKTARNAATAVRALLPDAVGRMKTGLFGSQFIENDDYSWHGPTIELATQSISMPDPETVMKVVQEFLLPVDSAIPEVAPAEAAREDR